MMMTIIITIVVVIIVVIFIVMKTCFEEYAPTLVASLHHHKATKCQCSLAFSCLGTAFDAEQ